MDDRKCIIDLKHIVKSFYVGTPNELEILHGIDLKVYEGEFISIVGASGSGKSTLMNIIGVLDRPTAGDYVLDGVDVGGADDWELSHIRNEKIGFVFQTYNLIPRTTALKNVELPMLYAGTRGSERTRRAKELLEVVEMEERMHHKPDELSGGQKQRVAIARALAMEPELLVADEPIASLDVSIQAQIVNLFKQLQRQHGFSILFIAHDLAMVEFLCDRVGVMHHGKLVEMAPVKELFEAPRHPYTRSLISAIPIPDPKRERARKTGKEMDKEWMDA